MKQSVYARNYESLMGAKVAKRPGMHSHGGPWEREEECPDVYGEVVPWCRKALIPSHTPRSYAPRGNAYRSLAGYETICLCAEL